MAKLLNESCMPCTMPRKLTRTFSGSFVLRDNFSNCVRDFAQDLHWLA